MPRRTRIKCSGIPHHLIQRGNNRLACFFSGADYQFYLENLSEGTRRYSCGVHAFAGMTKCELLEVPLWEWFDARKHKIRAPSPLFPLEIGAGVGVVSLICNRISGAEIDLMKFADLSGLREIIVELHPHVVVDQVTEEMIAAICARGFSETGRIHKNIRLTREST